MNLRALAKLSHQQEAFIVWLRVVPDCEVILSIVKGEPRGAKAQEVMLPLMSDFRKDDLGTMSGAELAILAAAQDLGYGTLKIKMAAHLVQGWCIGEQSVIFTDDPGVDNST